MVTILIIDDDEAVRQSTARILTGANHRVIEAANGLIGMKLLHAERPSAVICDLIMPVQEGIETIREIRRLAPQTFIIAISGSLGGKNADYLSAAKKLGADAVLSKPFRPAELLRILREGMRGSLA